MPFLVKRIMMITTVSSYCCKTFLLTKFISCRKRTSQRKFNRNNDNIKMRKEEIGEKGGRGDEREEESVLKFMQIRYLPWVG